jgi:hypothetical protein
VAARSKEKICGRLPFEIAGSNSSGGMDVCFECRVLSGSGLCHELINHSEESYRLWCVVRDLENSRMMKPWPALGRDAKGKKKCNKEKISVYVIKLFQFKYAAYQ